MPIWRVPTTASSSAWGWRAAGRQDGGQSERDLASGVILRVKVVGLFRTGIVSLDEGQAYILLKKAQILQ